MARSASFERPGLKPIRIISAPVAGNDPRARASIEIYKPFFLAGVICVLTAGCLLGAVALAGISLNASYTASAWTPYILAHANSQLFGWVGFFVMGFAMQQHAPSVARAAVFHRLAFLALTLMSIGIAVRFIAEPLVAVDRSVWVPVGVASAILQLVAVLLFIANVTLNRHRGERGLTWQTTLVFGSLFWLLFVSVGEPFMFAGSHAADPGARIQFIAEYFPPYREAQFLGFVTSMIFGVALIRMHTCFGAAPACPRLGIAGYLVWTLGLALRMGGWVYAFRQELTQTALIPYQVGGLLLALGATLLVQSSRMFGSLEFEAPSQKFVGAAFSWLIVGGLLMAFEPFHLSLIGHPFSHAYTGAIRHAVTVGFISQMIVGVGMHVVARMNQVPREMERPLWATFWLLNVGNAGRVALEVATDYTPGAFLPMGVTGFVELTGLALWGVYLMRTMAGARNHAPT